MVVDVLQAVNQDKSRLESQLKKTSEQHQKEAQQQPIHQKL